MQILRLLFSITLAQNVNDDQKRLDIEFFDFDIFGGCNIFDEVCVKCSQKEMFGSISLNLIPLSDEPSLYFNGKRYDTDF